MNTKDTTKPKIFSNPFLIGLIIMLVVGVVIGYGVWGKKEKTPNAQRLLSQVADHIKSLEGKNSDLKDQIFKRPVSPRLCVNTDKGRCHKSQERKPDYRRHQLIQADTT